MKASWCSDHVCFAQHIFTSSSISLQKLNKYLPNEWRVAIGKKERKRKREKTCCSDRPIEILSEIRVLFCHCFQIITLYKREAWTNHATNIMTFGNYILYKLFFHCKRLQWRGYTLVCQERSYNGTHRGIQVPWMSQSSLPLGHWDREEWWCPFPDARCPKTFLPTKLHNNEDTGVFFDIIVAKNMCLVLHSSYKILQLFFLNYSKALQIAIIRNGDRHREVKKLKSTLSQFIRVPETHSIL